MSRSDWGRVAAVAALFLFTGATAATASTGEPGPHGAGWTTVQVTRADGTTFDALLLYPALSTGEAAPYDATGAPYPAISFGHGFIVPATRYASTLAHLATWGYFVLAPRSFEALFPFPDHARFGQDISRCFTFLEQQNADPASPLYQQVDTTRYGVSGHSMGGGCSVLAAAGDPRIDALANLAAAETNPSAAAAAGQLQIPMRIIAAELDAIAPPESHAFVIYAGGNAPRQAPVIRGASHCGFLDTDILFCDDGEISRGEQLVRTRRLLTDFFNLYLRDEQSAWRAVWGPEYLADTRFDTSRFDPGVTLTPTAGAVRGVAGREVTLEFALTNDLDTATAFDVLLEDHAWPATIVPAETDTLASGSSTPLALTVALPTAPGPNTDRVTVSARAMLDGGTRAFAQVDVTRIPLGDLDCDGVVGFADINPFVLALSDPAAYAAAQPHCDVAAGDCNVDGVVDFGDINAFVALLARQ